MGGHDEKLKNFGKSIDRSIAQIERGFQKLGH